MSDSTRNNVLIVGNGFDIALGLPTKYSDFVNSEYWPIRTRNTEFDSCLRNFFLDFIEIHKDELGIVRWIDIENLLLQYAQIQKENRSLEKAVIHDDADCYNCIVDSFSQYTKNVVSKYITKECKRNQDLFSLITAIQRNGTFNLVYSFNYTPTADILEKTYDFKPNVIHLHGQVDDLSHPIILGISDKEEINPTYAYMRKSEKPTYESHNLNDDLFLSDLCVFYGLSFGCADFIYFKRFFEATIKSHSPGTPKKQIHIFTYDETSRKQIVDGFREQGLVFSDLYAYMDINIYKCSEISQCGHTFDKFSNLLYQLDPNADYGIVGTMNILRNMNKSQ